MNMRSHYLASGARWAVLAAMVIYAMGVGVAPALHFAEDGAEVNAYVTALAGFEANRQAGLKTASDEPPPPPPHHVPDGVDCLFCLVLSAPDESGLEGTPVLDVPASPSTPTLARAVRPEDPLSSTSRARAPPRG